MATKKSASNDLQSEQPNRTARPRRQDNKNEAIAR